MKFASFRILLVVSLLVIFMGKITAYDVLIKRIYETYGTAGIIIASTNNYQTFDRLTTWYGYSKDMSNLGMMHVIVNFSQLERRMSFYIKKTGRPLVVILLGNMIGVQAFAKVTARSDMGYPIWLIVFTAEKNPNACDFCRNPDENLFHLSLRSEVLVSCCDSGLIEEWWSKTGENTDRQVLAEWNDDTGELHWFVNRALYNRRQSLDKRGLRIAIAKASSYIWRDHGSYHGFLGEILDELSKSMNFTISEVIEDDMYGYWNTAEGYWTGVIGALLRNEADIAFSEFVMTNRRLDVVDFTLPIAVGECRLYIQKPSSQVQWDAYFKAFQTDVWTTIISLIITVPFFLTFIKYWKNCRKFQFYPLLLEHYLSVWGIYCQQGLAGFPDETSLRIAYTSIVLSALILTATYAGTLISFLTASPTHLPFNSMEEFVNDGSYSLIVGDDTPDYEMFRDSNETIMRKMRALMKPRDSLPSTLIDAFEQICRDKTVALYTNEAIKQSLNKYIPCELASIKTGRIDTLGMILPRRSQYLGFVNHYIQQFEDIGLLRRLKEKYFLGNQRNDLEILAAEITSVIPILCVLVGGFISGIVILFIERIIYRYKRKPRRTIKKLVFKGNVINVQYFQRTARQ